MPQTHRVGSKRTCLLSALLLAVITCAALAQPARNRAVVFAEDFSRTTLPPAPASAIIYDAKAINRRVHTPSLAVGKNNALVLAFLDYPPQGGKVAADMDSTNNIKFASSTDGGQTWSKPWALNKGYSINPTFLRTPAGDLWLFYNGKNSDVPDDCKILYCQSTDNGRTWSEARQLDFGYRVGIIVNNGTVLKNGDWLITFHYDRHSKAGQFEYSKIDFAAGVMISSDQGQSWQLYGEVEVPNYSASPNIKSWPVEPVVVETRDGRLVMFLRTRAGHIYQSTSYNNGRDWTEAAPLSFSNNESKVAAISLSNGHLVMLWNNCQVIDHTTKRFPLMASLSEDGGRTWAYTITLNDDHVPLHYPTLVELDGAIKIVYGHNLEDLRFTSLREGELRQRWTALNKRESWRIADGVLQMTDDRAVPSPYEWTKWPKLVALLPHKPRQFVLEADVRFDGESGGDGALGLFSSYQDEDNWLGWVWSPGTGEVGMEKQRHFGHTKNPTQYRASRKTWFENFKPRPGQWYRVRIAQHDEFIEWELRERGGNKTLSAAKTYTRYDGHFIGLGALRVKASFDNIVLQPLANAAR